MNALPVNNKILIAVDCWISPDQKAFMAVIRYFISNYFYFYTVLLSFSPLQESHTGENLASELLNILKKYNLVYQILSITTDNIYCELFLLQLDYTDKTKRLGTIE